MKLFVLYLLPLFLETFDFVNLNFLFYNSYFVTSEIANSPIKMLKTKYNLFVSTFVMFVF